MGVYLDWLTFFGLAMILGGGGILAIVIVNSSNRRKAHHRRGQAGNVKERTRTRGRDATHLGRGGLEGSTVVRRPARDSAARRPGLPVRIPQPPPAIRLNPMAMDTVLLQLVPAPVPQVVAPIRVPSAPAPAQVLVPPAGTRTNKGGRSTLYGRPAVPTRDATAESTGRAAVSTERGRNARNQQSLPHNGRRVVSADDPGA